MSYSLVWFKRDLRWQDHMALTQASQNGPVRCIYVIEPELWLQADTALQHFEFIRESLQDLDTHLRTLGGQALKESRPVAKRLGAAHAFATVTL